MPRVEFETLAGEAGLEAVIARPPVAPQGYTPIIYLTEWLTLNCRGDWASRARAGRVTVRFADPADHARAVARFRVASGLE